MEEKLNRLFEECLNELKIIGINVRENELIGEVDISIAKRKAKRYGCCRHEKPDEKYKVVTKRGRTKYISYERFYIHHIEISKWVLDLNESIIKNTIMHELIHCFPFCNNHGKEFKKYANYINKKLGYEVSRVGNKEEDYKKSNLDYNEKQSETYKYKIQCTGCNQLIYRKRLNASLLRRYRCAKCGGKLSLLNE